MHPSMKKGQRHQMQMRGTWFVKFFHFLVRWFVNFIQFLSPIFQLLILYNKIQNGVTYCLFYLHCGIMALQYKLQYILNTSCCWFPLPFGFILHQLNAHLLISNVKYNACLQVFGNFGFWILSVGYCIYYLSGCLSSRYFFLVYT